MCIFIYTFQTGSVDRREAASALLQAWQACHPAGPPLLIRRCGRALGRCLGSTHAQAAAYFAASSFAVTARQQMTEALRDRCARRLQDGGGLADEMARLQLDGEVGAAAVEKDTDQLAALEMRTPGAAPDAPAVNKGAKVCVCVCLGV
jgi:hypothetical protein